MPEVDELNLYESENEVDDFDNDEDVMKFDQNLNRLLESEEGQLSDLSCDEVKAKIKEKKRLKKEKEKKKKQKEI